MNRLMTGRETAIILAALRIAQMDVGGVNTMPQMEDQEPTNAIEIDQLCEDINCGTWEMKR